MADVNEPPPVCNRLYGGSVRDCACRLPYRAGWLPCPEDARGVLVPNEPLSPLPLTAMMSPTAVIERAAPLVQARAQLTGDSCQDCGSFNMVRAGTCLLCRDCGSTSGGCS